MCCIDKDTSLPTIFFFFFVSAVFATINFFFPCGWILGYPSSLADFLGWDWLVWKPCPTVAATLLGAFASVPRHSFASTGFHITPLELICEDQKLLVYWPMQILFPWIQAEIQLALSGVNLHFSDNEGVQLYKWFENCCIHVYENEVIMCARYH